MTVGADCYVGAWAVVMARRRLGDGSTGAVVTRDFGALATVADHLCAAASLGHRVDFILHPAVAILEADDVILAEVAARLDLDDA